MYIPAEAAPRNIISTLCIKIKSGSHVQHKTHAGTAIESGWLKRSNLFIMSNNLIFVAFENSRLKMRISWITMC